MSFVRGFNCGMWEFSARGGFFDNFAEFGGFDFGEVFAAVFEFLEGFDDGFSHAAVGFFGAADEREIFASGDAFVTVFIISTNA
jgi:hypothetical protein